LLTLEVKGFEHNWEWREKSKKIGEDFEALNVQRGLGKVVLSCIAI